MAKTKIDFRTAVPTAYQKPLYATVGAGDLAVTAVLEYVADVQKRITDVQKDVETRVADVQKTVNGLTPSQVRARVENRVADLQDEAVTTYEDLAKRGEALVKGTRLPSTATVQVGENGAEVKVTTTNPAARKAGTTRKPAAAKKAPAKKAPAKKAPARKSTATKSTTVKAPAAKKA